MEVDPRDRTDYSDRSGMPPVPILAVIVLVVGLGVWAFFGRGGDAPAEPLPPRVVEPAPLPEPEPEPPAPDIPEPVSPPESATTPEPRPEPALALQDSDGPVRAAFAPVLNSDLLGSALQTDNLLERGTAVIDGLSRGVARHKLLPVSPPAGKFAVVMEGSQALMDPAGYRRYSPYVDAVEAVDVQALVKLFDRFRPLLEEAYAQLGYEADEFDNALVSALDRIVQAPTREGLIEVRKVEAVYKFEDAKLEQLPGLHKQFLRMGPENTRRLQAKARELRRALVER